ncbi:type I-PGING CRISPR-associated protein Cas5p [Labilibaculum euxinus]|uniref:Type I-PGING CRISPR-associated protein Cas5p n=1 Tax=Labilibaculum euxinus TaxID=2686357 RepID=A0A7M4D9T3_9BACT|nr:type I-PGING CRISPR-associated protein Cas5p [Labilibaculum euxinus]MUP39412.1 type I-PGING CRISPR-associated protein Cas5p [Labilibaculum euxinus]MVB08617.1 type I-PGING CRISPR-associated protein Cas5p [Labilibaculum euxinus]
MYEIDISILKEPPKINKKVILEIEPLAPLSMVSDLPGSFYKSLKSPSKKMICGLFENILGWHIDIVDRKNIQKDIILERQKGIKDVIEKRKIKARIEGFQSGSTYIPFLYEYFEVGLSVLPETISYNDLWSKAYRRADADVHPKGTMNISYELIPEKRKRPRDEKNSKKIASPELFDIFKNNIGAFPLFYSTPVNREFIAYSGSIQIGIEINLELLALLKRVLVVNNVCYLGSSEGWVNLNINEL